MPSYLRQLRSYSYPPCVDNVDLASPSDAELPDIDEDPFSHFLTPVVEEDDPYDGLAMSAGIIVPDGSRTAKSFKFTSNVADRWARYVRQHHVELHNRYHDHHFAEDEESFMQLDDDRLNNTPQVVSHLTRASTPRITITEPTRGRAQDLVSRKNRRRYSRTLSNRRHSWREPSPDLFTVEESEEEEVIMLRRVKSKKAKDGAERRRQKGDVVERSRL